MTTSVMISRYQLIGNLANLYLPVLFYVVRKYQYQ